MLDDLVKTIETLQERIKEHGHRIGAYESRTRAALIDPMLCALGWNVADPSLVDVEYDVSHKTEKKWIDYALLDQTGQPVCFVEAKKLDDKSRPVSQTIGNLQAENEAKKSAVRYCVSTNGDQWIVYDATKTPPVEMETSIMGRDASKSALELLALWMRSLQLRSFNKAHEPLFDVEVPPLPPPPPPPPPLSTEWTSLTGDFLISNGPRPVAVQFPDGQSVALAVWQDLLSATADWLYGKNLLTVSNCREATDSKRHILSPDGLNHYGKPFVQSVKIGSTGIVLDVHLSNKDKLRYMRKLLTHFSIDPSAVYLKFP